MPIVTETPPPNLADMSVSQLTELIQRAESARREKVQAEKRGVIERLKSEMSEYQITAADLEPARRGRQAGERTRQSPKPKYRDPESGIEWSGRGRMAARFRELVAQGHKIEEYLIDKPQQAVG
jgi:DNA-binding protein H-NS